MIDRADILRWLREDDTQRLQELWELADAARIEAVGEAVHLRGLIEISSYCRRSCGYCGLRAGHAIKRYRMTLDEILECAGEAVEYGYGTVVLQAGEDTGLTLDFLVEMVKAIKARYPLAITLSLGELEDEALAALREAGADRYLLRFETSNPEIFAAIHPSLPGKSCDRIALLRRLRELGYEVGSGVMIGIPGTTYDDLANDLELFGELDLDMIGMGPYIAHPDTPLGQGVGAAPAADQVPNTEMMTYKAVALARLICRYANIPSTTALATLNLEQGRELGLQRGANVVMPNLTPPQYRAMYEIYPAKACISETARQCHQCMKGRIKSIGRTIGAGKGNSLNWTKRQVNV